MLKVVRCRDALMKSHCDKHRKQTNLHPTFVVVISETFFSQTAAANDRNSVKTYL